MKRTFFFLYISRMYRGTKFNIKFLIIALMSLTEERNRHSLYDVLFRTFISISNIQMLNYFFFATKIEVLF